MNFHVFNLISYIICELIYYYSMHLFFSSKHNNDKKYGIIFLKYILCALSTEYIYFTFDSSWIYTISTLLTAYIICSSYKESIINRLLLSIFYMVFGSVFELISGCIAANVFSVSLNSIMENNTMYNSLGMFLSRILLLGFALIFHSIYKNRTLFNRFSIYWIVTFLFPLGSTYIFIYIISNTLNNSVNYTEMLIAFVVLFLMNISVFYFFDYICRIHEIKEQNIRLLHYHTIQSMQQKKTDAYNQKIATMRHDMKNYLLSIAHRIETGNTDEILNEIASTNQRFLTPEICINSNDSALNYILNAKLWDMQEYGIELDSNIQLSTGIPIDASVLSTLLGNALDNAIEYVHEHPNAIQKIKLQIIYDFATLNIKVTNGIDEDIVIPDDYIITSTKPSDSHGFGIKSMIQTVNSYNGLLTINCIDKEFVLEITMPVSQ